MSPQLVSGFNGDALTVEFELVCLRMSEEVRRQIELPNQFELGQLILDAVDPIRPASARSVLMTARSEASSPAGTDKSASRAARDDGVSRSRVCAYKPSS